MEDDGSLPLTALQRKILLFFKEHPQAVETARGISAWVGEEAQAILESLAGLLERQWLTADQTSAVTAYALTTDTQALAQIAQALGAD